ncbi:MAG: flagellar motor protein MotB [Nitrospinota bacterium]
MAEGRPGAKKPPETKGKPPAPAPQPQKKAPEQPPAGKSGAPAWVVTFADLSTLMLTFFILLLSFANMDVIKFKEMLGSVQNAFGVTKKRKGDYQPTLKGKEVEKEVATDGTSSGSEAANEAQREKAAKTITKAIAKMGEAKNAEVSVGKNGVNVKIKGGYLFDSGKASVRDEAAKLLGTFAMVLEDYPFKLKIEGHTDNIPISTEKFPSNWELSAIRATTVLRFLSEKEGVDKHRLTAIGYADTRPLATNEEAWGRRKNRRVEFVFHR